jgi:SET domain-containing protein
VFAMKDIEAGTELSILYSPDEGHDASAPFQCDCNLSPSQRNTVSRISSTHAQSLADKAE